MLTAARALAGRGYGVVFAVQLKGERTAWASKENLHGLKAAVHQVVKRYKGDSR